MKEKEALDKLLAALGHRRLSRTWAKLEILLGLGTASGGMLVGIWAVSRSVAEWAMALAGWLLMVLGGYLALAGSRSHIYQSANELAAYVVVRNSAPGVRDPLEGKTH